MNVQNRWSRWPILALALCVPACAKDGAHDAASAEAAEQFKRMSIDELTTKMDEAKAGKLTLHIYDNNNKDRFAEGHIPGAKWVQFDAVKEGDLPSNKDATLVFYCASEQCMACHTGAKSAVALGFKNVYILPAGIKGWEKAQKPVEKV